MTRLESRRVSYTREMRRLLLGFVDDAAPVDRIVGLDELSSLFPVIRKEFRVGYSELLDSLLRKQVLLAYRDVKRFGLVLPDRLGWLEDFLKRFYTRPFAGKNLRQRITAAANNLVEQIKNGVRYHDIPITSEQMNVRISRILAGKSPGYSSVSPFYWSNRLLMGEAKRAYWDSYVDLSVKGDALVEWVLNPSCRHCSVCMSYSQEYSPSLTGLNDGPKPGVYRASLFPGSPHPWCGCFPHIYASGVDR